MKEPSPNNPLAYKQSYQDFYGRNFIITKDTLIPRPETEQLVDLVLTLSGKSFLPGVRAPKRILPPHPIILDVGTGTGCIAITLAKELPEADVFASDISLPALKIAKTNANNLKANISFFHSDLLTDINFTPDLVVANLPYVDPDWPWLDKKSLSKEPSIALYANDHGLALIKKLIIQASHLYIPHLILEADPCQHDEAVSFAHEYKYNLIKKNGYVLYLKYKK